ncbi:hypothetical protein NRQ48_RS14895 [Escherichia coli]|nr:hypothetical protein [Escherichia coli]
MKPSNYAVKIWNEVNGNRDEFFKVMIEKLGKSFSITERNYYAIKSTQYNRYA